MSKRCKAMTNAGTRCKKGAGNDGLCGTHRAWESNDPKEPPRKRASQGDKRKCGAKAKSTGKPCQNPAGFKTDHVGFGRCHLHGGRAPGGRKAAQKEIAQHAVETYGLPREVQPHDALLEEIWRTSGHVDWLEHKVREHEPEALIYGVVKEHQGSESSFTEFAAKPSVWLQLYQRERRHLVDVCRVAIAAGIAERQVALAEQYGKLIARVITGVLDELGVGNKPEVPGIIRRHLALVEGGAA